MASLISGPNLDFPVPTMAGAGVWREDITCDTTIDGAISQDPSLCFRIPIFVGYKLAFIPSKTDS